MPNPQGPEKPDLQSVKSTQKITKAMQMVAAAKLRAHRTRRRLPAPTRNAWRGDGQPRRHLPGDDAPRLLAGTGKDQTCIWWSS
jgi:F-type H+-transporting ATPase subunit gamma